MASTTLLASANPVVATAGEKQTTSVSPHRIQELSLQTSTPLQKMAEFYKDVLEMNAQLTGNRLVIDGGKTQITFTSVEDQSQPFYHFAFNIPENKIVSARNWLGERTKLAITPANQRDKNFPNEVKHFRSWNAHSVFFWDPAGNILELICRHDMKNGTKGEFRSDEILYASEIGFVTEGTVDELAGQIKSTFQLPQYRGGGSSFKAIGDETGLLILFQQGGTPVGAQQGQSWQVHPTDITIRHELKLKNEKLPFLIKTS